MKNDIFEKWEPINNVPRELYLDDIVDNYDGLRLLLRGEDDDRALCFKFGLFVMSYQVTQETCILKKLDANPILKEPWPLYIAKNSGYIQYLIQQSYNIENGASAHYVFKHADGLIEVVATKHPIVDWSVS